MGLLLGYFFVSMIVLLFLSAFNNKYCFVRRLLQKKQTTVYSVDNLYLFASPIEIRTNTELRCKYG